MIRFFPPLIRLLSIVLGSFLWAGPPVITSHPANPTSVIADSKARFRVSATGTPPLTYQWMKNKSPIPGATADNYTTPITSLADSGTVYSVSVSNTEGTVISDDARLEVSPNPEPPSITTQPQDTSVILGQKAYFRVLATGARTLTYQWMRNGAIITGATSKNYNTTYTTAADNGARFCVRIANANGEITSDEVTLTVTSGGAPVISQFAAVPSSIAVGQSVTLSWIVTGAGSLNLSSIGTVTGNQYIVSPTMTTTYVLTATNEHGSAASNTTVTVTDTQPPTAPFALAVQSATANSLTLTWTASTDNVGVTGYCVYRDGLQVGTSTNTWYYDPGLTAGTTYSYTVAARDAAGNMSPQSEVCSVTTAVTPVSQIIADHTCVGKYADIPQRYLDEVRKMLVDLAGESHSGGYRAGLEALAAQDPRFAVTTFLGNPPAHNASLPKLRFGNFRWVYQQFESGVGEEDFFTNSAAIDGIKSTIQQCNEGGNPLAVIGFGWCYDMTQGNGAGGGYDSEHQVHWAGRSEGGPQGSMRWGLNADDLALTGNSICMDTYLSAVEEFRNFCRAQGYATVPIFTTGPVDDAAGKETGVQREIKHDYIRNFVKADPSRVLFDYADILCWNEEGIQNKSVWNSREYAQIHPDNDLHINGADTPYHIGPAGTLRLAKAMWWMLARMAGWDGCTQ